MWTPLALMVGLWLSAPPTPADPDVAAAREHFLHGRALYREGKFQEAISEFEAAYLIKPNGVVLFNVGRCYERLGDLKTALQKYQDYLREVPTAQDRPGVEEAIARLEKQFEARGVQELFIKTQPSGAEVTVDARMVGKSPLSAELPPGTHSLRVAAPGFDVSESDFEMPATTSLQMDISLRETPAVSGSRELPSPSVPPQAVLPPGPSGPRPLRPTHTGLYLVGGIAVAAGVTGLALGSAAEQSSRELRSGVLHEHADAQRLADAATSRALGANVSYGTAGVALVAGVVFFIIERRATR